MISSYGTMGNDFSLGGLVNESTDLTITSLAVSLMEFRPLLNDERGE
jgi:hypothetical protein